MMLQSIPMHRKEPSIETEPCVVEKTVELPKEVYERFCKNLLLDQSFIADSRAHMYQEENGIHHCLLVLGEGHDDGVLVDSQGYSYARYSAPLPCARQLLMLDRHPSLAQFCSEMSKQVQSCVEQAMGHHEYGQAVVQLSDDILYFSQELFTEMLSERPEIDAFTVCGNNIEIALNEEYVQQKDLEGYRQLTAGDLEVMCAKHILWLHDAGGQRADFSGCAVCGGNLSGKDLNSAILEGAKFIDTSFHSAELCYARMQGAEFVRCNFSRVTAEESQMQKVKFKSCQLPGAMFTHSNLYPPAMPSFEEPVEEEPPQQNIVLRTSKNEENEP